MPYSSIQAITLDLDDTLWPVWPTIKKAEAALHDWLKTHAPSTAALLETPETMRGRRETLIAEFPHLAHDYNFLRTEAIRRSLVNGGDDPALAVSPTKSSSKPATTLNFLTMPCPPCNT
jgi:putative hydrolase of the HAD superfamily